MASPTLIRYVSEDFPLISEVTLMNISENEVLSNHNNPNYLREDHSLHDSSDDELLQYNRELGDDTLAPLECDWLAYGRPSDTIVISRLPDEIFTTEYQSFAVFLNRFGTVRCFLCYIGYFV